MKTINFFRFGAIPVLLTLSVTFLSGQKRPGIECGCDKTGDYVEPKSKGILVEQGAQVNEGSSSDSDPKYTLTVDTASSSDVFTIIIKNKNGTRIFNEPTNATGWGFSPDEDKFVMFGQLNSTFWVRLVDLDPVSGTEGELASVVTGKNLISTTEPYSANIRFSPHGKYLLYASIGYQGMLFLSVYDTKSGQSVYNVPNAHVVGLASGESVAGWGFSPDINDASFVHSYLTDVDKYSFAVVNLTKKPWEYIVEPGIRPLGHEYWRFSPCGDKFARIFNGPLGIEGQLYNTNKANDFVPFNPNNYEKLISATDGHYVKFLNGSQGQPITDNTADGQCDDVTKPSWGDDKMLDTGIVEGVNMGLHWDGATDESASGVTEYRIYKNTELIKEIEALKKYTVTNLMPGTEYTFRIEAGDETGNWSDDGPVKKFSTFADATPSWPHPALTSDGITETKITLHWNAASDDYGIVFYQIIIDNVAIDTVNGDVLTYKVKDLKAGTKPKFRINAIDAAGQSVSSGPDLTVEMAPAVNPTWPDGAALRDSACTETSLVLYWPEANDNCDAIVSYHIYMNGDSVGFTKYYKKDYTVKSLEEGKVYTFEVYAIDESGGKSPSLKAELSTLPTFTVMPLITGPGNQKRPDISGKMVVWWDDSNDDGDIYSYNLETDSIRQVTTDSHAQWDPAVSGERIVWADNRNDIGDIYMYDPVLGEVAVCKAPGSQDLPAIDGDIIVWRDGRNGDFDIYMYDIKTKKESPVSTHRAKQNWPDVSGNYVVYADDRNGNWDIYMYSIYDHKETSICTNPADQTYPVINGTHLWDIGIAYMDERDGKNIYVYYPYFIQGQDYEFLVPLDIYPAISGQYYPHLADKQLVYQDYLGGAGTDWNIWAFQFRNDTWGKKKEICVDQFISADQTRPRTSKGNIVWQDERNGNSDIYIWKRPPGSDLQLSLKEITDPIVVGDTLRYVVTVQNDGPGINLAIRTECTLPVMAKYDTAKADKGVVTTVGKTITWDIDTLRNGFKANLEIVLVTFDLAVLDFKAATTSASFDPDPSNNEITETTKVKNFVPCLVGEGSFPSIQVEPDGKVHMVYFANDNLMYATRTRKGKWDYKSLGSCVGCMENDILLDKDSNVQIVMSDRRGEAIPKSRLYQGTLTKEGHWSKKIIAISDTGFHSMSLKADSHNELHLVYMVGSGGLLKEMSTVGGVWNNPVKFSGGYNSVDMEVDKGDNLQVGYYEVGMGPVYQKKNPGVTWSEPEQVEPGWRGAQLEHMVTSIFTDESQNPHISYVGQVNNDNRENIKYAWKTDGKWNISKVDDGGFQSAGNKVVIDPDGKANFSYIYLSIGDYFVRDVRYATNIAGPWIKQIIEEDIGAIKVDMGRDLDKYTHIVYSGDNDLVYYALLPQVDYFGVDPDTLDFKAVEQGSEKTLVLKLSNPLPRDIRIDSIVINDDGRISFDKTSFILNRFASDSVKVTFKQTADPWTNAYLRIWYNMPSGLFMDIPVIAKNRQPQLTIDQVEPIYFGAIPSGTSLTKTVKLSNTGYADLIISSILVQGYVILGQARPTDFSLAGHNCSTLHPGETCNIEIRFQAGSTNYQSSFLKITSNDPSAPYKQITVYGEIAYPQISYHGGDIGFCLMGQSVTKSISIENVGHQDLNITGATLSGADATQFSLSNPCTVIEPGYSCKMQVTLTPNRVGDFQATLTVTSNSRYNNLQNIPLTGTSSVKTLELSVNNIDFGSIHVGEQAEVLLELRNNGSIGIDLTNIQLTGNDEYEFRQNPGCNNIAAGVTCIDTVWFTPWFEGAKTANLLISSTDSYNPVQLVTLNGQAGAVLPLQVSISADPQVGTEPLDVQLHASPAGGQPPYFYQWEFDDLKSSMEASPVHKFTGPGIYNVFLKLTDINNLTVTTTVRVAVSEAGIPIVLAKANPVLGEIPLEVQFDALATGGNPPLTFLWEFRDGSSSNMLNPFHTYSSPGSYMARITATDADGDISRDSVLITTKWNNSLTGQLWDETAISHISKSKVVLYPQSDINDTTMLILNGSYSYLFSWLQGSSYTVQAVPDPVAYPGELPTYFGDKIALFEASWIEASGHVTGKDIRLIKKPSSGTGTGTISGDMVSGSKKGITITEKPDEIKGNPVAGAYVYLKGSTDGKVKAYDITSSDGSFSFKGLDNESYYFVADYQGKPMDAANTPLIISDSRKEIEILATVGIDKITVKDLVTGINDATVKGLKVYPVPANDLIMVEIPKEFFNSNSVRMRILDLSGKHVYTSEKYDLSGNPITITIDFLRDGMYLLEVADNEKSYKVKIVKMR